jgi:DNA-dependent RNA polymerase auxiliary subunit epsilon
MRRILRVEGQDAAVKRTLEVMENHVEFLHALSGKFVERK